MKEQEIYAKNISKWLPNHKEHWVWINGEEVMFYERYGDAIEDAHRNGYTKGPVFIEEIIEGYQMRMFPGRVLL